jgi:NAD(P)-dependent dehydrogenase (short-subunit alcohol dehydrogenase family)
MVADVTPGSPHGRSVVVTGTSTGLGRACVLHLDRQGFRVFAGVRRAVDAEKLVAESTTGRLRAVVLDVTRPDQIAQAVAQVRADLDGGVLWALVNNAGVSVPGPLECLAADRLRDQFETNVVGSFALIQAFLPLLRASRGRIVNVTSGLGRVALPYLGAYAAAQFAKEGMSDALRRELKPFGVAVSVVQPGAIATPIWDKIEHAGRDVLAGVADDTARLYRGPFLRFLDANARQAGRSRTRPEDFAAVVGRVLTARRPKTRYTVGADVRMAAIASRLVPDALLDRYLGIRES